MSDRTDEPEDDRPSVIGIDPDMNIGDEDPAATERAQRTGEDDPEDERVDVEDLP